MTETIVAVSSPAGSSLRAIVRLSGRASFQILSKLLCGTGVPPVKNHGQDAHATWQRLPVSLSLCCPGDKCNCGAAAQFTDAIAYLMPAPHSYTREDVVELHVPGSLPVLRRIVELCHALGAQPAGPGEMTKRAFLAGRIDLIQAEAVAAIIEANDEASARLAAGSLSGTFSSAVGRIIADLIHARASLEAALDFSDQDVGAPETKDTIGLVKDVEEAISGLLHSSSERCSTPEGLRLAVVGEENVGKSTLFNALTSGRKTIVSPIPGTTRDVIEGRFSYRGRYVTIYDTAGVQCSAGILPAFISQTSWLPSCPAKRGATWVLPARGEGARTTAQREGEHASYSSPSDIAMNAATTMAGAADILLLVVDSHAAESPTAFCSGRLPDKRRTILALNKIDLLGPHSKVETLMAAWRKLLPVVVPVSGLFGHGIQALKRAIATIAARSPAIVGASVAALGARHRAALEHAGTAAKAARSVLEHDAGFELACLHLQESHDALSELLGERPRDELLDSIFSRFCIGK